MLLTCEANRFYASGFHSTGTDGVALVTREGNFYFTDSRYIEAAHNKVQDAEIAMTDAAHPYVDLINAAMEKTHVQKLGFEDAYMTVADYRHYSEKLHCQMVPATELLISLRQSKDEEEKAGKDLPPLEVGSKLKVKDLKGNQHFTQPPPRYTEASICLLYTSPSPRDCS